MRHVIGRHAGGERLGRHRHSEGYLAIVIAGGYLEAGDRGRLRVSAGDLVSHCRWSAHRDEFSPAGASVLNLPLPPGVGEHVGRISDVDAVARLAETDAAGAAALALEGLVVVDAGVGDWPDMLAAELNVSPDVSMAEWADRHGVACTSLSRGFTAAFGVSPKRFRLEQRTRRALASLPRWVGTLAALAAEMGFADQAHLSRSVKVMTGRSLGCLR